MLVSVFSEFDSSRCSASMHSSENALPSFLRSSIKPVRRLKAGETMFGGWLSLTDPVAAELMSRSGFDYLFIDTEHGAWDLIALQTAHTDPTLAGQSLQANASIGRFNQGEALFRQNRYVEAEREFRAALELDPAYAKACYFLGATLKLTKRPQEAYSTFQKALSVIRRAAKLIHFSVAAHEPRQPARPRDL